MTDTNLKNQLKEILEDEVFQLVLIKVAKDYLFDEKSIRINFNDDELSESVLEKINEGIEIFNNTEVSIQQLIQVGLYFLKQDTNNTLNALERFVKVYNKEYNKQIENNLLEESILFGNYADLNLDSHEWAIRHDLNVESLCIVGSFYLDMQNYNYAYELLEKAVNLDPNCYLGSMWLGVYYQRLKNYDEAIHLLNKAISINSEIPDPYYYLGLIYYSLKNYNKSAEFFNKEKETYFNFVELKKNNKVSSNFYFYDVLDTYDYEMLIRCYYKLNEIIEELESHLIVTPYNQDLLCYLGICYFNISNYDKAIELCNSALKINPSHETSLTLLGCCYSKLKIYDKAINSFKMGIKNGNIDPYNFECLANTYLKTKEYDKAIDTFKNILKIDKQYGYTYYALGKIYEILGDGELSKKYFSYLTNFSDVELAEFKADFYQTV